MKTIEARTGWRVGSDRRVPLAAAAAGVVVLGAAPWLLDGYTLTSIARMMAIGLLAVSVAVLTGTAGLPSLGQVAPYAVGAYTTGLLARAGVGIGPVQLAAAAAAAAVFSTLVGMALVRTRGVVYLMATLAVGVLTATAAEQWRTVTGGSDGLYGIPAARPWPGADQLVDDRRLYWYTLAVATIAVVATALALRSRAGMLVRGVRDNQTRMAASGHPVAGYLLAVHTATGALAGTGGALLVTVQRFVSPAEVGFSIAALVLLAVIAGGATSIWAALGAAAVVVWVRDWAAAGVPGHGPLLLGGLFTAAVFLLPGGAATTLAAAAARLRHRLPAHPAASPAGPPRRTSHHTHPSEPDPDR